MRRDQRRRLLASRHRSEAAPAIDEHGSGTASAAAGYDDDAHPERHPAVATRLPVGRGRFLLAVFGVLLVFGGVIGLAVSGPLLGRPLLPAGGRFARTLAVAAAAFDPGAAMPVQVWLAELSLLLATVVAGAVRFMRRHRRDDFKGRFRAWGWLAVLLSAAAWSGAIPVGALVAAAVSDATGIVPGPGGIGWWVGLAAVAFAIVVPWAVLPLRERIATSFWIVLALAAWSAAAAVSWATSWAGDATRAAILAQAAWVAGAALMLIAMLAAARSVIREVRGECVARPARRGCRDAEPDRDADAAAGDDASTDDEDGSAVDEWSEDGDAHAGDDDYTDGSDRGQRRLSKAERKRLRKLARMNGTAA